MACGTGFLTRHLHGLVIGLDQSPAMVAIAQSRLPHGLALVGNALTLPFADVSFERVFTGHFYGHLPPGERARFVAEARRVAGELVVLDSAPRSDKPTEHWDERVLNDGSRHCVYKRYLSGPALAEELGGDCVAGWALVRGGPNPLAGSLTHRRRPRRRSCFRFCRLFKRKRSGRGRYRDVAEAARRGGAVLQIDRSDSPRRRAG